MKVPWRALKREGAWWWAIIRFRCEAKS